MEWMPLTVKSGDRRRDAASTRAGRTADWGNHSSLLESTRSFLCFPPSDHITTTSPTTLTHRLLPCVRSSLLSVVPASSQEFSLAAGSTENHRLSPKTHKVRRQTRSAINYLKLKSPSAWRWKRPLRPSTAPSERTDGGMGKASPSPCRGEERGTGGRRLIRRDRGCWLMKHGRCLLRENILILLIERGVANTKGYADTLLIRRITGECCLFAEAPVPVLNVLICDVERKILPCIQFGLCYCCAYRMQVWIQKLWNSVRKTKPNK